MTRVYVSLPLLRTEIAERIEDLAPTGYKSKRFKERSQKAQLLKPIQEEQVKTRLFQLGEPQYEQHTYIGCNTVDPVYIIPLQIVYPSNSDGWDDAIHDDLDCIGRELRCNPSGVSGVQGRWVDLKTEPTREPHEKDTWQIVTVFIWCLLGVN